MHLWQEQMMYRKLQELQRQQQLQQLDQGAREKSSFDHSSALTKPSRLINEASVNNTWPNSFVAGLPVAAYNPQMLVVGNMNWAQESGSRALFNLENSHILADNQSQATQSMGFMPQVDLSFQGMPQQLQQHKKNLANQYSQLFGKSDDGIRTMTNTAGYQSEKLSRPNTYNDLETGHCFPEQVCSHDIILDATQNSQRNGTLRNNHMQILTCDIASGKFQQENDMQDKIQFQQLHHRQKQDGWFNNLQERPTMQVWNSTAVSSLDPTEEKFLFGADEDNWQVSFRACLDSFIGGYHHDHPSTSEHIGTFPFAQGGSWRALVQEAVQTSNTDQRIQEEKNGLSFQKRELSMQNNSNAFTDTKWQMASCKDSNFKNLSSSTSKSLQFYDSTWNGNSHNASTSQHTYWFVHDEESRVLNKVPSTSFQLSSGIQFCQNQEEKQFLQSDLHLQVPVNKGILAGHTYDKTEINCSDMQSKSQNVADIWSQRENMEFASLHMQHINGPNALTTNYLMVPGDCTSLVCENDGKMKKLGAGDDNLTGGMQPLTSNIGSSQLQIEDSIMGNFGSFMNPNTLITTQKMSQSMTTRQNVFGKDVTHNTLVNSQGSENGVGTQNPQCMRQETWETLVNSTNRMYADTYNGELENPEYFSGEGLKSSHLNHGQNVEYGVTAKENQTSISDQNSFPGNRNYLVQFTRENMKIPTPVSSIPTFQGLPDTVLQGSRSTVTRYVGNSKSKSSDSLNNPMYSAELANEVERLQPRESINMHTSSGSFGGVSVQSSDNKRVSRSRQKIAIDLPHKDVQTRNSMMHASVTSAHLAADFTVSHPHFNQHSTLCSSWSSLPSQTHSLPNFQVPPQTSTYHRLEKEAGNRDKLVTCSETVGSLPREASQARNWKRMSGQEYRGTSNPEKLNFLVPIPYNLTCDRNQPLENQQHIFRDTNAQLEQQQQPKHRDEYVSNNSGHEGLNQTAEVFLGNSSKFVNKDLFREPLVTGNRDSVAQSIQTSLPIPACRVPPSWVTVASNTHTPAYSLGMDQTKAMNCGSSEVKISGDQFSVMASTIGLQSSVPGMSQRDGFSNTLSYVCANLSAQQRLAGLHPDMVAPNVQQLILNKGRETGSCSLQKADDRGNQEDNTPSEVGTSSVNSQDRDHQVVVNSFKAKHAENADSALSTTTSHGQEPGRSDLLDGSNVSTLSIDQHQDNVDKEITREDSAFDSQMVHSPDKTLSSPSCDVCGSGYTSVLSESPQESCFLLHQMQMIRSSDSNSSLTFDNRQKVADIDSNASQEQNSGYRSVSRKNTFINSPADGKLGPVSRSSFPLDVKMLSFVSEDHKSHSTVISSVDPCYLQTHMHSASPSSSSTFMRGNEHYNSSSQMQNWFKKFMNSRSDLAIPKHDGNSFPQIMENSSIFKQTTDTSKFETIRQSTLATTITPDEAFDLSHLPTVLNHDIVLGSKKRKCAVSQLHPWHKKMSYSPERLQRNSVCELAWTQAANRLIEKVGGEVETIEDYSLLLQARRRLILTTQMIQQLLPAPQASILSVDGYPAYERVIYDVSKSALADACCHVTLIGRDCWVENVNLITKKIKYSEVSNTVEEFSGRSTQLKREFSRLEKMASMLDVRLEWQELERFSNVNRLVKFHGRSKTSGVEDSSTSQSVPCRDVPQRHVTALPVPRNLPESVLCLSL